MIRLVVVQIFIPTFGVTPNYLAVLADTKNDYFEKLIRKTLKIPSK